MSNGLSAWVIELNSPGMLEPLQVRVSAPLIVGRRDPSSNLQVDIDLSSYRASERGVSRQHVKIYAEHDQLMVVDLGTANGSMVNDRRLLPNQPYPLGNDDQLHLGGLKLAVRIVAAPNFINTPSRQTEIRRVRPANAKLANGQLVLIVEDHTELAQLYSLMLQRQGFVTQISRDSNRAMRDLVKNPPDAVMLDVMLPGGANGIEVCRYIRRDKTFDNTPVIIVTASPQVHTIQEAMEAGADIVLKKPVNADELGDVIAEYIERRNGGKPIAPQGNDPDIKTKSLSNSAGANRLRPIVGADTVSIVVAGYTNDSLTLHLRKPKTFGGSADNSNEHHVDLSKYDASNNGVSRRHAILIYADGEFFVEDLGSLNGTYVNGDKLNPHEPVTINNGEELRLGQLSLYLYFLKPNGDA
ncbi:MAG: FHA domain-containing protein [Phototrophicaceae bacterium]